MTSFKPSCHILTIFFPSKTYKLSTGRTVETVSLLVCLVSFFFFFNPPKNRICQFPQVFSLNWTNVPLPEPAVPDDGVWGQRRASAGVAEQHRGQSSGEQRPAARPLRQETGAQQTAGTVESPGRVLGRIHFPWCANRQRSIETMWKGKQHKYILLLMTLSFFFLFFSIFPCCHHWVYWPIICWIAIAPHRRIAPRCTK